MCSYDNIYVAQLLNYVLRHLYLILSSNKVSSEKKIPSFYRYSIQRSQSLYRGSTVFIYLILTITIKVTVTVKVTQHLTVTVT